jgi:hypothetical protein
MHTRRPLGAIEHYRNYGDTRPPAHALERFAEQLDRRDNTYTGHLVAADVLLDLASVGPDKTRCIDAAAEHLDTIIDGIYDLEELGHIASVNRESPSMVSALLRKAELPAWRRVVEGDAPEPNYSELLSAAGEAEYFSRRHIQAAATLVEFMPVLLGERAAHQGAQQNWTGRQALDREDHRQQLQQQGGANWDCGLLTDPDPVAYISPPHKVEVKTANGQSRKPAHITTLRARQCGFANPGAVIAGCFAEVEEVPAWFGNVVPLSTNELDRTTHNILKRMPKLGRPQIS